MAYKRTSPQPVIEGGTGAQTLTNHGILYGSGTSAIAASTPLTNGQIIIGSTGNNPSNGTITSTGSSLTISGGAGTLNIDIAPPVSVPNGGTGATTLTNHGVLYGSGTSPIVASSALTNGQMIIGSTGNNPVNGTITSTGSSLTVTPGAGTLNIDISAPVSVSNGGTGATTLTNHGVLYGSGTSPITASAALTNGQMIIGSTGNNPSNGTITSTGSTLTVTPGAGTLNIDLASPVSVAHGGTGATTLTGVLTGNGTSAITANAVTQYRVLLAGASNAVTDVGSVGTTGQVLTSNGAGANPSWQNSGSGNVTGPGSSTDKALARWNGTGGNTLQDSTVIVTNSGQMTNASQPAFLATNSATDNNVTGNGTQYTVIFDNEVFDQGSNYNNATGTFTAPVTGRYLLISEVLLQQTGSGNLFEIYLTTSNRSYRIQITPAIVTIFSTYSLHISNIVDMDASDTAIIQVLVNGIGANTADVYGGADGITSFSGALIC